MLLLGLVVVAVGSLLLLRSGGGPESRAEGYERMLAACETTDCVVDALRVTFDDLGSRQTLETYMATSPDSYGGVDCHEATHELGRWAWSDDGREAWFAYPDSCNYGYYHGVTFEAAENSDLDEYVDLMLSLCVEHPLPVSVLPPHECAHGVGHAVFALAQSVGAALAVCESFPAEDMRRRCSEGVAKESLNLGDATTPEDLFVCAGWSDSRVGVCEYIASAYMVLYTPAESLSSLVSFCAGRRFPEECLAGVGRGVVMKSVVTGFAAPGQWAAVACGGEPACAEGFGELVYTLRNDVAWSSAQCVPLGSLQEYCEAGVRRAAQVA